MPISGPIDIPEHVRDLLEPAKQSMVVDRRGSTVWDVQTTSGRRLAVKIGYPTQTHSWTAVAPAREAVILRGLIPQEVQYGEWREGTWSAQPWREGESLFGRWLPCRAVSESPDLDDALACAVALSNLHDAGWAHGDVQPNHFIIGPDGTALIDVALARGDGEIPEVYDFQYRGCLVHYEAPEISKAILQEGTAVPSREADVYALGASFFISATGRRHVDYPDDAERAVQRQAIVDKPHRPINVPGRLGGLIEQMMNRNPADRPTSGEVCAELRRAG
ncbi:protein kinase [Streptomyces sp. NPDC047049]|uniref:protein kinase n=1 Tax=Streptomyces sp. NPDC047049 TaxID=3156688 RepID=UPI003411177D